MYVFSTLAYENKKGNPPNHVHVGGARSFVVEHGITSPCVLPTLIIGRAVTRSFVPVLTPVRGPCWRAGGGDDGRFERLLSTCTCSLFSKHPLSFRYM